MLILVVVQFVMWLRIVFVGRIVGRIKRTDGIDVSVELEHCLISVKHRELHFISTLLK